MDIVAGKLLQYQSNFVPPKSGENHQIYDKKTEEFYIEMDIIIKFNVS